MYRYGGADWAKKNPLWGGLCACMRYWLFTQYHSPSLGSDGECLLSTKYLWVEVSHFCSLGWYNARLGHLRLQSGKGFHMAQNGGGKGWKTDTDTGKQVMPPSWRNFLDWLLMGPEREPSTQKAWAEANGVHSDSLRRWKRDPRFIREWDRLAAELNINPERVQSVVDALWQRAAAGDTKAASLYLQYVEKFTPKRRLVVDDAREVAGMSDSELADALESEVVGLRAVS